MFLITVIIVGAVVYALGRLFVRFLGWPTDLQGAFRWCLGLLAIACVVGALPATNFAKLVPLPEPRTSEVVPTLLLLGLAALGHHAWARGAGDRDRLAKLDQQTRFEPRRRAPLPEPVKPKAIHGFVPHGNPNAHQDPEE